MEFTPLTKRQLIDKYRETPEGRAKLATATFMPAQAVMEAVTNDPTLVDRAEQLVAQMEEFQGYMQGDEDYDRRTFSSLLEGLKMLSEEIRGKKVVRKL
jgi:hypothetical protein